MIISRYGRLVFIAGRAATIGARPAFLLIANALFGNQTSALVAAAYLVVAGINSSTSAEVHRLYYARFFGAADGSSAQALQRYVSALSIFCVAGSAVCLAYFIKVEDSAVLAGAGVLFLLTEKGTDEGLRFLLFQNRHDLWGTVAIARVTAQFAAIAAFLLLSGFDPLATYATGRADALQPLTGPSGAAIVLAAIIAGNAAVLPVLLPTRVLVRLYRSRPLILRGLHRGVQQISNNAKIWLLSLGLTFSLILDRSIVLAADKSELAVFSLIVASLSVIQTGVDLFFLSFHRRDILDGKIQLARLFRSGSFWRVIAAGAVIGLALAAINSWLYSHSRAIAIDVMALVMAMQICLACTAIAREVALWNNAIDRTLQTELVFVATVGLLFLTMLPFRLDYRLFLVVATVALALRLFAFTAFSAHRVTIDR